MSGPDATPISVLECPTGHAYVYAHERCPACEQKLTAVSRAARCVLISHTTVRVNPEGAPVSLGVARLEGGAKTLCILEGEAPDGLDEPVRLYRKDGLFYAEKDPG